MNISVIPLLILSLNLSFSTLLSAKPSHISQTNQHILLVTEHLPPLQYFDHQKNIQGYSYDIVTEVFKRANVPYIIKLYSWGRSYRLSLQKGNVCIFSLARIPKREYQFIWIDKLTETNTVMFGLKKNNIKLTSIEQAKQYNVAVIRDDVTHYILKQLGFNEEENLYVLDNTDSLLKLLHAKPEIDLIVADDITIKSRAINAGVSFNDFERLLTIENTSLNFHLACSLNTSKQIIKRLKHEFSTLKSDGTEHNIQRKWQDAFGQHFNLIR